MEYVSVSTKMPREETTRLKAYCNKRKVTTSQFIREIINKEIEKPRPQNRAGKNKVVYNNNRDTFSWFILLDNDEKREIMADISPLFLENLLIVMKSAMDDRYTFILQKNKDSVPIPTAIMEEKNE